MRHKPATVLIVDDDDEHSACLRELLECEGYAVLSAPNGLEALHLLTHERGVDPALIILDLDMPKMNGRELLTILRTYRRFRSVPVVILSGQRPLACPDVADWLQKPVDVPRLLNVARRSLHAAAPHDPFSSSSVDSR